MKKLFIFSLIFIACLPQVFAQNTHGVDQPGSYFPTSWSPIRHYEALSVGFGSGNKLFLGGRESSGNITWNAYPGDNTNWGGRYMINSLIASQLKFESWNGSMIFQISSASQSNFSAGDLVTWDNVFRLTQSKEAFFYGPVHAPEVRVQLQSWWDVVFEPGYRPLSLYEIEKYIQVNNRLPGYPSTAQVVNDGLNLGSIVSLHQKTVEELTLHAIDQQKQIDELKAEIMELKKMISTK
ncbi:MAG TPA: hypothetical protein DIW47_04070 [Bacteroidetes bacterium]|nr:hypothetical protein [Bacteroidota bacterium]